MATKELVRERLSKQIARTLEETITKQEILPGTQFPSERALAATYQVNRLIIREALRILEAKGLAITRPGRGTFAMDLNNVDNPHLILSSLLAKDRVDKDVIGEIFLFRRYLEMALVKLAARKAKTADYAALRASLEAMRIGIEEGDPVQVALADESIHRRIAVIAGSQVLLRLANDLWEALSTYQKLYFNHVGKPAVIHDGLVKVVGRLEAGDADGAAAAMEELLQNGDEEFSRLVVGKLSF